MGRPGLISGNATRAPGEGGGSSRKGVSMGLSAALLGGIALSGATAMALVLGRAGDRALYRWRQSRDERSVTQMDAAELERRAGAAARAILIDRMAAGRSGKAVSVMIYFPSRYRSGGRRADPWPRILVFVALRFGATSSGLSAEALRRLVFEGIDDPRRLATLRRAAPGRISVGVSTATLSAHERLQIEARKATLRAAT